MSKSTLTLLAVGMLGVGGFASMDTEALAQTLSEESNSRSVTQLHSRDTRVRHTESSLGGKGSSDVAQVYDKNHHSKGHHRNRGNNGKIN